MNIESNNNSSPTVSAERAWNLAVETTTRVGTNEAISINVLLYLALVIGRNSTLNERLRFRAKFFSRLRLPGKKPPVPARKGCPLFAFLYATASNTNNLMPVYQAAERRGWQPNLLAGEQVDLKRLGVAGGGNSAGVTELTSFTTAKEWLSALVSSRKQFVAVHAELQRLAPDCAGLIWDNRDSILSELAFGMVAARGLRRLYEAWEPSAVVSTSNMWPFDQAMYHEAQRSSIPSFVIQHGITNRYWWPFVATKMLLWGKPFEDELLKLGAPADMLAICGMPAADHLFAKFQQNASAARRPSASTYLILSDTHGQHLYPDVYPRFKMFLQEVVAATPNIKWCVKLHPVENESFYAELLDGRFPNFSILPKSTTLEAAVTQADAACTLWSTSGLEAMMMHRPLVVFDVAPVIHDFAWWPEFGGGVYVATAKAMIEFASQSASNGHLLADVVAKQDRFLTQNFSHPGRAAEVVLDTIQTVSGMPGVEIRQPQSPQPAVLP
jgi:hypothetical protein